MDSPKDPLEDSIFEPGQPILQVPVSGVQEPPDVLPRSPRWGATTKLIVGLSLVSVSAFLLFRFLNIVGPLLLAFILAYLIYPIAETVRKWFRFSWRMSATFVYLILLILVLGSIGAGGLALIEQVNSLITFLQGAVSGLPAFITDLTSHPVQIGPFSLNFQLLDANAAVNQILGVVQPILSQAGASVVSVATGAATVIGWMFFILLVSYFILAESGGFPNQLINLYLPGYDEDIHQLGRSLSRIWNAFLRGQVTIVLLTILIYNILLGGLGIRFFFGLALLAGLARFIPYVGPFVAWTSYGLVAFFQGSTIFGVPPLMYVGIVVGIAWLTDLIMDNFVVPRLMSNALRVHPAAVMVSALVAFNLLGVIGVVLAAPVLATIKLFMEYIIAKLLDQDPWASIGLETGPNPIQIPWSLASLQGYYQKALKHFGFSSRPGSHEQQPASKNQE
jgi:predicted PurR-regulated permease PerM